CDAGPMPTVLLVEDDHALRDVVARALREEGLAVVTAADGHTALASADPQTAAVVLDIGLPDADGRDVCLALRARGIQAPVLFLTAKDTMHDKLAGFAAGGDDYLTKPFHVAELMARLRVLLRRSDSTATETGSGLTLDPALHALSLDGTTVPLSPTEFRLLAALLGRPGEVVRRRELLRAAWPAGAIVHENTLDQYVARVRRKLAQVGATDRVETVRGVGYRAVSG
ncbi:MAG: response regulator transcription factor, partial [Mycobacteriales bacterium]